MLGQRLNYVHLAGTRLQDDSAEDPVAAVQRGALPDYGLYWHNKLQTPLTEIFEKCVSSAVLQARAPVLLVREKQVSWCWRIPLISPAGWAACLHLSLV